MIIASAQTQEPPASDRIAAGPQGDRPRGSVLARFLQQGLMGLVQRFGLVIVFAIMTVWFATNAQSGPTFRSSQSIDTIFADQAVVGLVSLAMVLPLVAGYFDLSVAANVGVSNLVVASLLGRHGWPIVASVFAGIAVSVVIGLAVGLLVAKLRLSAFIVTFGTYVLLMGLSEWYTNGAQIANLPPAVGNWGSGSWLSIPRPFWLMLVIALLLWFVLEQTPFGRYVHSIGSNELAAKLVGINTDRTILLSFVGSGLIAGVAGALLTSRLGGANATTGSSYLFPAFAAMFLGATVIRPGHYNVWGTVIAVYFVGTAVTGLTLIGADAWVYDAFNGAALVAAVALSTFSERAVVRRLARQARER